MNQKPEMDLVKAEALGALQMGTRQIAVALNIDLDSLQANEELFAPFMDAVRKGRAKGEVEIRSLLFKRAREGDSVAIRELLNYR